MSRMIRYVALCAGALVFVFPFYYMLMGSLQATPDTSVGGALPTGDLTLRNYAQINDRVDLLQSMVNSGIFTGGVLLGTVVLGVLAGYALARLHFRGQGTLFAVMLLVQIVPFQLLIIPI
jgi:multiple sugar transport system permease protein